MKSYETLTVGQIVADKYEAANVFEKYGIDYCCHGSTPLLEACKNANVELDQVQKELENTPSSAYGNIDFTNWPITRGGAVYSTPCTQTRPYAVCMRATRSVAHEKGDP